MTRLLSKVFAVLLYFKGCTVLHLNICYFFIYSSYTLVNDIALVKIRQNFTYNNYVQPICIERLNGVESAEPPVSSKCVLTGWGRQRKFHVQVIDERHLSSKRVCHFVYKVV